LRTTAGPFALLDDGGATARLYRDPVRIITAFDLSEVHLAIPPRASSGRN